MSKPFVAFLSFIVNKSSMVVLKTEREDMKHSIKFTILLYSDTRTIPRGAKNHDYIPPRLYMQNKQLRYNSIYRYNLLHINYNYTYV